jgi:hypothetical protein
MTELEFCLSSARALLCLGDTTSRASGAQPYISRALATTVDPRLRCRLSAVERSIARGRIDVARRWLIKSIDYCNSRRR